MVIETKLRVTDGLAMNTKLAALASMFALITMSQAANARAAEECVATADLRAFGTNDVIRVSNQSGNLLLNVNFRIFNAAGVQQGRDYALPVAANASISKSVGSIFFGTGVSPFQNFNSNFFIQVAQQVPVGDVVPGFLPIDWLRVFQATYKNFQTNGIVPLLFTCSIPTT